MRVFFDTSALAKLFVPEAGTDEMNAMLAQDGMEIWISALAPLEFHSLAWRRHREGKLDAARVTTGRRHSVALTPACVPSRRYAVMPRSIPLRRAECNQPNPKSPSSPA